MKPFKTIKTLLIALCLACVGGVASGEDKVSPTSTEMQAQADAMGQQTFIRKNGELIKFNQISGLPEKIKEIILDDEMDDSESKSYLRYQKLKTAALQARNAEMDKVTAALQARGAEIQARIEEKKKLVIVKYGQYVTNIERGASGERATLKEIIADDLTSEPLKRRAAALLSSSSVKWLD